MKVKGYVTVQNQGNDDDFFTLSEASPGFKKMN